MHCRSFVSLLSCTFLWLSFSEVVFAASLGSVARSLDNRGKSFYTRAHSLSEGNFKPGGGWVTVNATNLDYKYKRPKSKLSSRGTKDSKLATSSKGLGGTISHLINDVWNGLKGLGKGQSVKITWYTGHDLNNPSCWSDSKWTPTDDSFVSALTLQGWKERPKCFEFMELCNGPEKCVFVRVVDTCAGCAPGSKHVDLTKGAFTQLADLDKGVLTVHMRVATEPETWYGDLWGPRA